MVEELKAALRLALPFVREAAEGDLSYGATYPEDPRDFTPDEQCSTEEERASHAAACAAWERGERPEPPLGSTWEPVEITADDGTVTKVRAHVNRQPWGLGISKFRNPEAEAALKAIEVALDESKYPTATEAQLHGNEALNAALLWRASAQAAASQALDLLEEDPLAPNAARSREWALKFIRSIVEDHRG